MTTPPFALRLWLRRAAQVLALGALAAAAVYWFRFSPVAARPHRVECGTVAGEVLGTGTLEARVKTAVGPKIAGRLREVLVDQNDRVSLGQPLFLLDDEELAQQVAIAQANVAARQAALERLKADQGRAAAVAAQARKTQARFDTLVGKRAVSQEEMDRAVEALGVSLAGVAHAEAALAEGQRELVAAQKTLEYHRARLADTRVLAPLTGLVVRRTRDPGDVVVPGSSVLALIDPTELWVTAWVDETEMARLEPGQPARVVFRSEPDRSYPGRVARLGREADRETREFLVDVRVLELPRNWAVGQRAEAFVETARKDGVPLLPVAYLLRRGGAAGAFVHHDGRAAWRPITTGLRDRESVEVVAGLQAGDVVLLPAAAGAALPEGRRVSLP